MRRRLQHGFVNESRILALERSFFTNEYIAGQSDTFFEYALKPEEEPLEKQAMSAERHIAEFANNMLIYKDRIRQSLNNLHRLSNAYERAIMMDGAIDWMNSTIYRRQSQYYTLYCLFKLGFDVLNAQERLESLSKEIVNHWSIIRSIATRSRHTGKYGDEVINKSKNLINRIYDQEIEYYDILYSLLDRWKNK